MKATELPKSFRAKSTIGDIYGPAMKITEPAVAQEYFELIVKHHIEAHGQNREEAEEIIRSILGYFAGYYDNETRERVERLFTCAHPIFGPISSGAPTPEQAFEMGKKFGEKLKQEQQP